MLSDDNNKITITGKNFITVNRAEISVWFEQTELKFSLHVNELKIIMQSIIKVNLKMIDCASGFKLEKQTANS